MNNCQAQSAQGSPSYAFADFAQSVYPFLDLTPFHRTYYAVLEAFASFLGYDGKLPLPAMQPPCPDAVRASSLADALLQIYSPQIDSLGLKENPSAFEELRNNYMLRREPTSYKLLYKK